ncbi:MAG: tail fiber domain-containing protein, partial [Polaribacter sp.]|nr:tail fiber domain-containing protein [Polaribacter sp.]
SVYVGNDPSSTTDNANYNVAVGKSALNFITTGDNNVAVGFQGLYANTSGYQNTALGNDAMRFNTSGYRNTAIGQGSLYKNESGVYNTSMGGYSLHSNTSSHYSSAFGYKALYVSTGEGNLALGYQAGDVITTGTNNVVIGRDADPSANSATNQIVIGYGATGTGDNSVSLGNTSIGSIKGQVAFTTYSDKRIKKNIVDNELGLAFINKLHTVTYNLKNPADYPEAILEERFKTGDESRPADNIKKQDGLIAQEVRAVLDELGVEWSGWSKNESNGKQGIQYGALTVPLIKAVQEQQAQIKTLQAQVKILIALQKEKK